MNSKLKNKITSDLLKKCKEKDENAKNEIIKILSEYIYYYPIAMKYNNWYINNNSKCYSDLIANYTSNSKNVDCGEFFEKISIKIKKCSVFTYYNSEKNFFTYFNRILFNQYITLFKKLKRQNDIMISVEENEIEITDKNNTLSLHEREKFKDYNKKIFNILNIEESILYKLKYLPLYSDSFTADEYIYIGNKTGIPLTKVLKKLNNLLNEALKSNNLKLKIQYVSSLFNNENQNTLFTKYKRLNDKISKCKEN